MKSSHFLKPGLVFLVFIVSFTYCSTLRNRGISLGDDGNLIRAAQRILKGEIPYRDFCHYFYSPGRIYTLAILYKEWGVSYLTERWMWVIVRSVNITLIFLISLEFTPIVISLIPSIVVLLIPGPWFKSFYPLCGLLVFYGILIYMKRPSFWTAIALGAMSAFALFFRQDMGVIGSALAVFSVIYVQTIFPPRNIRNTLYHTGLIVGTLIALLGPYLMYMQKNNAFLPMIQQLFGDAPTMTLSMGRNIFISLKREFHINLINFILFLWPPIMSLCGIVWLVFNRNRNTWGKTAFLLIFSSLSIVPGYLPLARIRLFQAYHFLWILFVFLIFELIRKGEKRINSKQRAKELCLKYLLYAVIVIIPSLLVFNMYRIKEGQKGFSLFTGTALSHFQCNRPMSLKGETFYLSNNREKWMKKFLAFIQKNTKPNEPVIFLPAPSLLYYICDLTNPTRFIGNWALRYQVNARARELEKMHLSEIKEADVRYIFVRHKAKIGKSMKIYLSRHYRKIKQIGPLFVFERKKQTRPKRFLPLNT